MFNLLSIPNSTPFDMLYLYRVKFSPAQTNTDLFGCMDAALTGVGIVNELSFVKLDES